MRGLSLWIAAAFAGLLVVSATSSTAAAQRVGSQAPPSEQAGASYEALIREALSEFDARNYAEARALFERAHALKPNARTLRGLGITAFELKRYVQSLHELESALSETRNPLTEAQRRDVQELIEKARRFVGRVRLEVTPSEASVLLDGSPTATHDLVIDLGEHQVSVRAPGYRDTQLKLVIDGGEDTTQRVALVQVDVSPEHVAGSEPATDRAGLRRTNRPDAGTSDRAGSVFGKWWFWTAAGVVLAGAAVGTALALGGGDTTTQIVPVRTANTPPGARLQASMAR